jgi:hypothetical protein
MHAMTAYGGVEVKDQLQTSAYIRRGISLCICK